MFLHNHHGHTPYGHAVLDTGQLGFNGQLYLSSMYLLGNGHRCYLPTLARFISPDTLSPFGRGGINAYAYCTGDPVNKVDPSGGAGFLKAVVSTVRHVVKTGSLSPDEYPPIRKHLNAEVDQTTYFGKTTGAVNAQLASNGDSNIPGWKVKSYIARSQSAGQLRRGSTTSTPGMKRSESESALFLASAGEWAKVGLQARRDGDTTQLAGAFVGVSANIMGALVGAAHDHIRYKTGTFFLAEDKTAAARGQKKPASVGAG